MIADLATCEWNPGVNRSVVSIEIAAKRVRSEDRSLLISRFNNKLFDDQVTINRKSVTSKKAQYSAVISNMNFGTGRICGAITRYKWKETTAVSAIVFWINGRAYGYASVCGNLFELDLERSETKVQPPVETTTEAPTFTQQIEIGEPVGPIYAPPDVRENSNPYIQAETERCYCFGESSEGSIGFYGDSGGGGGIIFSPPPKPHHPKPIPAVPELPVWSYLGIGAALLAFLRRKQ